MDVFGQHKRAIRELLAKPPFGYRNIPDNDLELFASALVHDSYSNEAGNLRNNERLEFLGDAVLEFVACEHIYRNTDLTEGGMTGLKQEIVRNRNISEAVTAYGIELDEILLVGGGHINPMTKRPMVNENMRADAFEALLAAIYLTYGMEDVRKIVQEVLVARQLRI
ncbi:MAG: ribonuclease [Candidatus Methanomethylophilaceae archaeon]|nr:ribonuclease [Candidatus Methanomethylophilaceae archaeon]